MSNDSLDVDYVITDDDAHIHTAWDNTLTPIAHVESGAVVTFVCRDAAGGDITPATTAAEIFEQPFAGHAITGPIAIEGVTPGDVLEIELLEISHGDWGYTYYRPAKFGRGLLPEQFPDGGLHHWELGQEYASFDYGVEVPIHPFPGIVGVAPAENGSHHTAPPRWVGGNMDIKQLTEGSTVYLPVAVEDGLLSIGDGHAAQGDGEVCLTGIETPLTITARITHRPGLNYDFPRFVTSQNTPTRHQGETYGTVGIGSDLLEATKDAVTEMINHIHQTYGLTRGEAYLLCSVAVDLTLSEVVNPNYVVSATLPTTIFDSARVPSR